MIFCDKPTIILQRQHGTDIDEKGVLIRRALRGVENVRDVIRIATARYDIGGIHKIPSIRTAFFKTTADAKI